MAHPTLQLSLEVYLFHDLKLVTKYPHQDNFTFFR